MRKLFQSMETFAKRLVGRKEGSATGPRPKHYRNRLQRIEQLEQRTLLSISSGIAPLNIDDVWAEFSGIDGTGVKVGVIATLSTETAEMADIINDATEGVAKGATVLQETATTEAEFVTAVSDLQDAGVDVIVAAPGIYQQAWFEDGAAALAVQRVIAGTDAADGTGTYDPIVVVTAAGDDSDSMHYQGTSNYAGDGYQNFASGKQYLVFDVEANGSTDVYLTWNTAWGGSDHEQYDFDLHFYEWNGSGWDHIVNGDGRTANPWEEVSYTNTDSNPQTVGVRVFYPGREYYNVHPTLELLATGDVAPASETPTDGYATNNPYDAIFGPAAVTGSITVGAANYDTPTTVAAYSSRGPSTVNGVARASLDGVAVDDVTTTAVGTGTAAAYTGGIVALMLDMNPHLDPADVHASLVDTAFDLNSDGNAGTTYDNIGGNGLFNAYLAMMDANPYDAPDLTADTDRGPFDDDNVTNLNEGAIVFTGQVDGDYDDVVLFIDDVDTTGYGFPAWETDASGNYTIIIPSTPEVLALIDDGTYAVSVESNGVRSPSLAVTLDNTAPANLTLGLVTGYDTGDDPNDNITNLSELLFAVTADDTGSGIASVIISCFGEEFEAVLVGDRYEATPVLGPGEWSLSAVVTDLAGNEAWSDEPLWVTVDQTEPAITLDGPHSPRDENVESITLFLEEEVVGLDLDDLKLTLDGEEIPWPEIGVQLAPFGEVYDYQLTGLDTLTGANGHYELTLNADGSGIEDIAGNPLVLDSQVYWDRYGLVVELTGDDNLVEVRTDETTHIHTVKVTDGAAVTTTYETNGTIYIYIDNDLGVNNRAYVYDSEWNDTFVGEPYQATMDWGGEGGVDVTVVWFSRVDAYATSGGSDEAFLTGTAGADTFRGLSGYSYIADSTGKTFALVSGFDYVEATGEADDKAYFWDTASNDTFYGGAAESRMELANGVTNKAKGFGYAEARASTAAAGVGDQAFLTGTAGADRFYGFSGYSQMLDSAGKTFAIVSGFDYVEATGEADDKAYLYDSALNDLFTASGDDASWDWDYLDHAGVNLLAKGFGWVGVISRTGGSDAKQEIPPINFDLVYYGEWP